MPKVTWSTFVSRHPAGHLVVAGVTHASEKDFNSRLVRDDMSLLGKLLRGLAVSGDYALTIMRTSATAEIHAGFEKKADADRLAGALNARGIGRFPGWASQRGFRLDEQTYSRITKALGDLVARGT